MPCSMPMNADSETTDRRVWLVVVDARSARKQWRMVEPGGVTTEAARLRGLGFLVLGWTDVPYGEGRPLETWRVDG